MGSCLSRKVYAQKKVPICIRTSVIYFKFDYFVSNKPCNSASIPWIIWPKSSAFSEKLLETSNTIYTREEIVASAIEKAKKYYGIDDFEHIISFGDGLWDATTAENLGLHFVGVNEKNLADFKKQNVQYCISDWEDFDIEKAEKIFNIN